MSQSNEAPADFELAKATFLRFADVVRKANSGIELRALLLSDTVAPYHQHNLLDLANQVENIGDDLCRLISADLDEDGVPS